MNLTDNFTLQEMTQSQTALRLNIDNTAPPVAVDNLRALCQHTLEPVRAYIREKQLPRATIRVNSGYRSEQLNRAVNGATTSQHLRGEAADIEVSGLTTLQLFDAILESGVVFDQIIQEFDQWVHISYTSRRKNRRSVLYAYMTKQGKTVITKRRKTFLKHYNIKP